MTTPALIPATELPAAIGTRRGFAIYRASPFITDTYTIRTTRKSYTVAKGSNIIDSDTGAVVGETTYAQVREVDAEQFVKIYSAEASTVLGLATDGARCFLALFHAVQNSPSTDVVDMDLIKAQEIYQLHTAKALSERAYFRGMKELQAAGIVAAHVRQGWYFINPSVLFNGDRVLFLNQLRRKAKEATDLPAPALTPAPEDSDDIEF